tara:strand:- start:10988 stop:11443 length:456 start_codon:yes stop_codon:yes gene_type:complete
MKLDTYINRIKNLSSNLEELIYKELKEKENFVLAIPKRRLYQKGTDAFDVKITPPYKPSTIRYKKNKGQVKSHVTLRDTGKLYSTFKIVKEGKNIDFTVPNNSKTIFLTNHYEGNELFGFSPNDGEKVFELFIKPFLEEIINPNEDIDIEI